MNNKSKCTCANFVPVQCKAYCCGPVPINKDIYFKNKHKCFREVKNELWISSDMILPDTQQQYCTFLGPDDRCLIYNDRPDLCKKFGKSDSPLLQCPFMDKHGKKRTAQERELVGVEFEQALNAARLQSKLDGVNSFF